MTPRYKVPYFHSLGDYRRAPDAYLKHDVDPFLSEWKIPGLTGRPTIDREANPERKEFYFKFFRVISRQQVWIPICDVNTCEEYARGLIQKSMGVDDLIPSDKKEFLLLRGRMKRLKIKYYEI
jgi:hypothetical protein